MARKIGRKKGVNNSPKRQGPYNVPNQEDFDKLQRDIEKFEKSLSEDGRPKPLTVNQYKQIIRSAVRERWMRSPAKLAFLHKSLVPDYDIETRRRFKCQCNMCKCWFTKTSIEIDHIEQEQQFIEVEDGFQWASSILNAGGEQDLQTLCTFCHEIKSHMDRTGYTYNEAVWDKKAIELQRTKTDKQWIEDQDCIPESNAPKRRAQIIEILRKQYEQNNLVTRS